MCYIFIFSCVDSLFALRFRLWSMNCWEVCCVTSKGLEVIVFCYWFLDQFPYGLCMISVLLSWLKFVSDTGNALSCWLFHGHLKKSEFCYHWAEFSVYVSEICAVHFSHILLDVLFSSSVATHSGVLIWEIPWTEELGRLQSIGSQRQTWPRS